MQVPEEPGCYEPTPKQGKSRARNKSPGHVDVEPNASRTANTRRYGSYVVRAPPSPRRWGKPEAAEQRSTEAYWQGQHVTGLHTQDDKRRFAMLKPFVESSISRSLSQQGRLPSIALTAKTGDPKDSPSNSRQGRYLARFTKELEKYCMAATTGAKAPLPRTTPTVSESPTTLNTISDLLPYQKQFNAAGLAVTAREQMLKAGKSGSAYVRPVAGRKLASSQVDGSTVTSSEQEADDAKEAMLLATSSKKKGTVTASRPTVQAPSPVSRSIFPWIRQNNPRPKATRTHSSRKISKDHIHPSQAAPAEALLTPAHNLILDSYFDPPQPQQPQDEQPRSRNTSMPSPTPSTKSSFLDKPLPKQPSPIQRHPVPMRNQCRHMENTAEWPTAGVLIHDSSSPPQVEQPHRESSDTIPPLPDPESASPNIMRSRRETPQQTSVIPPQPQHDPPPVPRQESNVFVRPENEKTAIPLTSLPKSKPTSATSLCRGSSHSSLSNKPLPVPDFLRDLNDSVSKEDARPASEHTSVGYILDAAPQLPVVIPESSSSFEKALDAVISKLDAMEERKHYERKMEFGRIQPVPPQTKVVSDSSISMKVGNSMLTNTPVSGYQSSANTQGTESGLSHATDMSDGDISDRDVLIGLKMAICAACDEHLDGWIREKTGLRLRRFLADLRAFESISRDKPSTVPVPLSRQIRRNEKSVRKSRVKQVSGKRPTKKWTPCFGGDGSTLIPESSQES